MLASLLAGDLTVHSAGHAFPRLSKAREEDMQEPETLSVYQRHNLWSSFSAYNLLKQ